jgi:UDP-glucose 4-epimerase
MYDLHRYAINVGALKSYTINEAMDAFVAVTGYRSFRHVEERHEVKIATCTTGLAEYKLGWDIEKETKLRDGLAKMWAWAKQQPDRPLDSMPPLELTVNAHSSL